jgi:hypothetical protein
MHPSGQRGACLLREIFGDVECHTCLHVDERDVVREHVVQLACDTKTLLTRTTLRLLGTRARQLKGALTPRTGDLRDGEKDEQPRSQSEGWAKLGAGSSLTRYGSQRNEAYPATSPVIAARR